MLVWARMAGCGWDFSQPWPAAGTRRNAGREPRPPESRLAASELAQPELDFGPLGVVQRYVCLARYSQATAPAMHPELLAAATARVPVARPVVNKTEPKAAGQGGLTSAPPAKPPTKPWAKALMRPPARPPKP